MRNASYYVVRFESIDLKDGNTVGIENILDDGNRHPDVFGSLLALRLISGESIVAECLAVVESDGKMRGSFLGNDLVQRVAETHYGARIHPF